MAIAADPGFHPGTSSLTKCFGPVPPVSLPDVIGLSPVLDMLGVRYVIFEGSPPASIHPPSKIRYWVLR